VPTMAGEDLHAKKRNGQSRRGVTGYALQAIGQAAKSTNDHAWWVPKNKVKS